MEAPPNICTPTHIARAAQGIAKSAPDVMTCQILEEEDCKAMNMGCFLGVAECSAEPLKFVHLTYKPKGKRELLLTFVILDHDSGFKDYCVSSGCHVKAWKEKTTRQRTWGALWEWWTAVQSP